MNLLNIKETRRKSHKHKLSHDMTKPTNVLFLPKFEILNVQQSLFCYMKSLVLSFRIYVTRSATSLCYIRTMPQTYVISGWNPSHGLLARNRRGSRWNDPCQDSTWRSSVHENSDINSLSWLNWNSCYQECYFAFKEWAVKQLLLTTEH